MRSIKPNTRRRPLWHTMLLPILAIAVGGAGTVAALAYSGVIDPAKLAFWRSKEGHPADWIAIPVSARPIPAYTTISRDYLIDLKTGTWAVDWVPPENVPKGAITKLRKIYGRVTARDKPTFYSFTERDFLPEGSSPGVTGGTPEGKRAITLDAGKLKGAHDLKEGDHIDLLASIPVDMPGANRSGAGRSGMSVVAAPNAALLPKRSVVRPLVQDGVVVTPERTRNVPISSSSLMQGTTTRTVPVQEIVLAVVPEEVAPLAEAMDLKYEITCVARSGRPASVPSSDANPSTGKHTKSETSGKDQVAMDITPGLNPMADIRFMEVLVGAQRQFVLFTGPGNSPVVAMQDDGSAKPDSAIAPAGAAEGSKQ
jgi:Flp pilus assembly protein CpaB